MLTPVQEFVHLLTGPTDFRIGSSYNHFSQFFHQIYLPTNLRIYLSTYLCTYLSTNVSIYPTYWFCFSGESSLIQRPDFLQTLEDCNRMPYGVDYNRESERLPSPEVNCVLLFSSGYEKTASGSLCLGRKRGKVLTRITAGCQELC